MCVYVYLYNDHNIPCTENTAGSLLTSNSLIRIAVEPVNIHAEDNIIMNSVNKGVYHIEAEFSNLIGQKG